MASKHIFKIRRGIRHVDNSGNTLLNEDSTPVRNDWATYTAKEDHMDPLDGELVVEFEYNPNTGKSIPRLKIGDGKSTFADLEYIGIESFIFPEASKPVAASVNLKPNGWVAAVDESGTEIPNRFYQEVIVAGADITPYSKIDLQPSPEQLVIFHKKDITFTTVNRGGSVRVCVVGQKPTSEYTIQATVTEVAINGNS